jgi:hypothetical protein
MSTWPSDRVVPVPAAADGIGIGVQAMKMQTYACRSDDAAATHRILSFSYKLHSSWSGFLERLRPYFHVYAGTIPDSVTITRRLRGASCDMCWCLFIESDSKGFPQSHRQPDAKISRFLRLKGCCIAGILLFLLSCSGVCWAVKSSRGVGKRAVSSGGGGGVIKMDRFLIRKSSGEDKGSPQKKPKLFGEDVEVVGSISRKVKHDFSLSLILVIATHNPSHEQSEGECADLL